MPPWHHSTAAYSFIYLLESPVHPLCSTLRPHCCTHTLIQYKML
uniref:Uncharacterized protein n=1 Tax=Anguilla anguilla TaxID=7936 RepID=A0A0E9R8E7_ANGAN